MFEELNNASYAYFRHAVAIGTGSVVVAAAGTGIVANAVQSLFSDDRPKVFKQNLARNVLAFEGLWLTYAGICALTPAASGSYVGLAISGALAGVASKLAAFVDISWVSLRGGMRAQLKHVHNGLASLISTLKNPHAARASAARTAFQSSTYFVTYQAVFSFFEAITT